MIICDLAHLPAQVKVNFAFEQAIAFLRREGWRDQMDGKIPIDGECVFGMLQAYDTKIRTDTVLFEGHRKYIDVQYIIEGRETIFVTPTAGLIPTTPYDEVKDIWFCQSDRQDSIAVSLKAGQLVVLFPEDAHAPTYCFGAPTRVRKIVVKVAV